MYIYYITKCTDQNMLCLVHGKLMYIIKPCIFHELKTENLIYFQRLYLHFSSYHLTAFLMISSF